MKTKQTTTIEKPLYHKPELKARVNERLRELQQQSAADGKSKGLHNKPALLQETTGSMFKEFHCAAQELLASVAADVQPASLVAEVQESETMTEREVRDRNNRLFVLAQKHADDRRNAGEATQPFGRHRMLLIWIAICVPVLGDGFFNRPAFEAYGYNYAETIVMSLLLAGSLTLLAHCFGRLVALGKTIWQQREIAGAILSLVGLFFYCLSEARSEYLAAQSRQYGDTHIHYSPLVFAAFSLLLFIIAVAINHFFYPTRGERNAMKAYEDCQAERQADADERAKLEHEIADLKNRHDELRQMNYSLYNGGAKLEEQVIHRTEALFEHWKSVNIMYRPDNGMPKAFLIHEYPFAFTRHFKPIELY